jgi:hypothetical protein
VNRFKIACLGALAIIVSAATVAQDTPKVATRQVHLDFHTSEEITDIGKLFSKTQFQEALRVGHVEHVNIFAKGSPRMVILPDGGGAHAPSPRLRPPRAADRGLPRDGRDLPHLLHRRVVGQRRLEPHRVVPAEPRRLIPDPERLRFLRRPRRPQAREPVDEHVPEHRLPRLHPAQVEELCQRYDVDGF